MRSPGSADNVWPTPSSVCCPSSSGVSCLGRTVTLPKRKRPSRAKRSRQGGDRHAAVARRHLRPCLIRPADGRQDHRQPARRPGGAPRAGGAARRAPEHRFLDEGYSGATLVRPALERLRDAAAAGALDRVYVHAPDRLARRYAYQVLLVDELRRAGVEIVFLNRAIGLSPEDDLLLQVQGMVAEYERAKILERSRRGKRHAAREGAVSVLSGAPYGYRYVSKHDGGGVARYEIIEEQAQVVRQIFGWVGRDRVSIGEVCRRLQRQGYPTRG